MDGNWVSRYLTLLEVEREAPSVGALDGILRAHRRVTFENMSSLLRRQVTPEGPVPDLDYDAILSSWEAGAAGGVCYEVSEMLARLLSALGYDTSQVLCQIGFPRSHQAAVVTLEGRAYLADAGNGAPIFTPIALDETREVRHSGLAYRFRPETDEVVQDRWIKNEWSPFASYETAAASDAEREESYQGHHLLPARSFVMACLRLVRCEDDAVYQLLDHTLTRYSDDGKQTEEVYGVERYREVIADVFKLPAMPVADGLAAWCAITGNKV